MMPVDDARAASEYEADEWAREADPLMRWPDMQATLAFWMFADPGRYP